MGRWGEAKGIMKAMFLIKPIRAEMNATLKISPSYGGAHRVLGEMLWQIPGFAGGDKKGALAEYEKAVSLAPGHSSNYLVLADAYEHFDRKDDAIKALNDLLAIQSPDDPAEFKQDSVDARERLAKMNKK
jgi:tetratricopeptide (TPR) repeat protein